MPIFNYSPSTSCHKENTMDLKVDQKAVDSNLISNRVMLWDNLPTFSIFS